jgi:hypothetical protein
MDNPSMLFRGYSNNYISKPYIVHLAWSVISNPDHQHKLNFCESAPHIFGGGCGRCDAIFAFGHARNNDIMVSHSTKSANVIICCGYAAWSLHLIGQELDRSYVFNLQGADPANRIFITR